ncbi:GNAT family N-acetyltransferase [Holzapfeliella sp. He02]|uniref:GNAT family N-acetyltransferase n=1 Tax=Holzapfeliella saturejae TaxID=3082953 RepID=A0ABU8SE24_9LACO
MDYAIVWRLVIDVVLETKRTKLRAFKLADSETLYKWGQNPVYKKMAGYPEVKTTQDAINLCKTYIKNSLTFAIESKQTHEVIGVFEVNERGIDETSGLDRTKEVGFLVDERHWGQGIMTEVLTCMLDFLFNELDQLEVWAACYIENDRCQHLLEKVGFTYMYQLDYSQLTSFIRDLFESVENYYRLTQSQYNSMVDNS